MKSLSKVAHTWPNSGPLMIRVVGAKCPPCNSQNNATILNVGIQVLIQMSDTYLFLKVLKYLKKKSIEIQNISTLKIYLLIHENFLDRYNLFYFF